MQIDLKFERRFFEEIFYFDNRGSYFKGDLTKKPFQNTIISGSLSAVLIFYMIVENTFSIYTFVLLPLFLVYCSSYIYCVIKLSKRKRNIKKYLDKIESLNSYRLFLDEDSFTIQLDQEKYKELWSAILFTEISEMCIYLSSEKENYMFPKKSFLNSEWLEFKKIIQERTDRISSKNVE